MKLLNTKIYSYGGRHLAPQFTEKAVFGFQPARLLKIQMNGKFWSFWRRALSIRS